MMRLDKYQFIGFGREDRRMKERKRWSRYYTDTHGAHGRQVVLKDSGVLWWLLGHKVPLLGALSRRGRTWADDFKYRL